jgi:hypothetical protein
MAERDAFGRLPDENPLAGLGSLGDGIETHTSAEPVAATAASDPVFSARPAGSKERAAHAKPETPSERVSSSPKVDQSLADAIRQVQQMSGTNVTPDFRIVGRVVKLVVFLVVIGIIASVGGTVFDASKSVRDTIDSIPSPSDVTSDSGKATGSGSAGAAKESAPPTGLSANSMLTRRNFARAMARLRTSGLGRMRTMSVRPERIDAQLLTKGGSLRSVQIRYDDPEIDDFGAGSPGFSHLDTIPFARINTRAPARLARGAAGRAQKPVSQIDYVTLNGIQGTVAWGAYLKGGKIFLANSRGRITRRIS